MMMGKKASSTAAILSALLASIDLPCVSSFASPIQNAFVGPTPVSVSVGGSSGARLSCFATRSCTMLQMSGSEDVPRRRRKRKDGKNSDAVEDGSDADMSSERTDIKEAKVEEIAVTPTPVSSVPVQMQVTDVRDLVAGKGDAKITASKPAPSAPVSTPTGGQTSADEDDEDENLEDDEEYEYYYEDENNNEVIVGTSSTRESSSLEDLLADARRIRKTEEESSTGEDDDESSITSMALKVVSNIVTADFFVVCALLAWFLAGIFCSYILKDDTVQIAFNGIFEPVVQPALGVLMIGSVAGTVFNKDEEEY